MKTRPERKLAASFRDPSGFLFWGKDGRLFRQINTLYQEPYEQLMSSGLYQALVGKRLLIPHQEVEEEAAEPEKAYKVIEPEPVAFISYPYEWSFSQLKDAALTTLAVQRRAMDFDMSLKDASAFNIQFHQGRPILIDTLSFEPYQEGQPWVAYRQFCQHFLAPLVLMAGRDVRLGQLFKNYIDGIPLDLASQLLPWRSRLSFGLLSHIHLHASAQKRYAGRNVKEQGAGRKMGRTSFLGIIDSLKSTVEKLEWEAGGTAWADYEDDNNYSEGAMAEKARLVEQFLGDASPEVVWDLGANTGRFSRIASQQGIETISFDMDPAAVERNYLRMRQEKDSHLLPLLLDLTNPTPAIGWRNVERESLVSRGGADTVLALALIHHLAITNNLPLAQIADFLAALSRTLIIEFVPKEDSQVQKLLAAREDIFPDYNRQGFEAAFSAVFQIEKTADIPDSLRTLYLMRREPA
jgi:ribosomal protein L11 methylase PrmA